MGNKILKEYDVSKTQLASGGIGMYWRMYEATHKKTKEPVCIHSLEKDRLPKKLRNEAFYSIIRKETNIARLKHPHILRVLHPIDESSSAFILVSEPILCTLANAIGDKTNIDQLPPRVIEYSTLLSDLDLKNGFRQIAEALLFLHRDVKMYHNNVCPGAICVTKEGHWKLSSFLYAQQVGFKGERANSPFDLKDEQTALLAMPSLKFLSPELGEVGAQYDDLSDSFSLGKTIFYAHRFVAKQQDEKAPQDFAAFRVHIKGLFSASFEGIPAVLTDTLRKMLSVAPSARPDVLGFLSSGFFNDVSVRTLKFLDSLFDRDVQTRIEFFKALPQALSLFDTRSQQRRVLPPLLVQMRDESMAVFCLPSILLIARGQDSLSFQRDVLPLLVKEAADGRPPQVTFILLKNLDLLMSKSPSDVQASAIVPMLLRCLESQFPQLRQQALKSFVPLANEHKFPFRVLKSDILPRVLSCVMEPGDVDAQTKLSLRVAALICLSQIFMLFDTDVVESELLEAVGVAVERDRSAAVLMCGIGLYEAISKALPVEVSGRKILPKLIPLALEPNLNSSQFATCMRVINEAITRLSNARTEQLRKKEDLDRQKAEHSTADQRPSEDVYTRMSTVAQLGSMLKSQDTLPDPASMARPVPAAGASAAYGSWGAPESAASPSSGAQDKPKKDRSGGANMLDFDTDSKSPMSMGDFSMFMEKQDRYTSPSASSSHVRSPSAASGEAKVTSPPPTSRRPISPPTVTPSPSSSTAASLPPLSVTSPHMPPSVASTPLTTRSTASPAPVMSPPVRSPAAVSTASTDLGLFASPPPSSVDLGFFGSQPLLPTTATPTTQQSSFDFMNTAQVAPAPAAAPSSSAFFDALDFGSFAASTRPAQSTPAARAPASQQPSGPRQLSEHDLDAFYSS